LYSPFKLLWCKAFRDIFLHLDCVLLQYHIFSLLLNPYIMLQISMDQSCNCALVHCMVCVATVDVIFVHRIYKMTRTTTWRTASNSSQAFLVPTTFISIQTFCSSSWLTARMLKVGRLCCLDALCSLMLCLHWVSELSFTSLYHVSRWNELSARQISTMSLVLAALTVTRATELWGWGWGADVGWSTSSLPGSVANLGSVNTLLFIQFDADLNSRLIYSWSRPRFSI